MRSHLFVESDRRAEITPNEALELVALHSRESAGIDRPDGRTLATLADVAETLDIDVEHARRLLAEVRSRPRTRSHPRGLSGLALVGWVVAAIAIAAAVRPSRAVSAAPDDNPIPSFLPQDGPVTDVATIPIADATPPGYGVSVKGQFVRLNAPGLELSSPLPRPEVRRRLIEASIVLLEQARKLDMDQIFRPVEPNKAMPLASGTLDLWLSGRNTGSDVTISIEPHTGAQSITSDESERKQVAAAVDDFLNGYQKWQTAPSPTTGGNVAFPPPGFDIEYKGRRQAMVMGGGGSLMSPFDHAAAQAKLVAAMRGLMERDLKPIPGQWRQRAAAEKKLVTPAAGQFTVWTSYGSFRFSVPLANTLGKWYGPILKARQDRKLKEIAEKLVHDADAQVGKRS